MHRLHRKRLMHRANGCPASRRFEAWAAGAVLALTGSALAQVDSDPVWIRQLGTTGYSQGYARGAATDGAGGVFVVGYDEEVPGGTYLDIYVTRYDAAGNLLWQEYFRQIASWDYARAAAADGHGGLFVAGSVASKLFGDGFGGSDGFILHVDGDGSLLWAKKIGTTENDQIYAMTADGEGGVFVAGFSTGSLGGPNAGAADAFVARCDSEGNPVWITQFGTDQADYARTLSPDGAGGVYVGGDSEGGLGGPNQGDVDGYIARFDAGGQQVWAAPLATAEEDRVYGVHGLVGGGVIAVGYSQGSLFGPSAGTDDALVGRYDAGGSLMWGEQFGTPQHDRCYGVTSDGAEGVYVCGMSDGSLAGVGAGDNDIICAHYDLEGSHSWIGQIGGPEDESGYGCVQDGAGGAFVFGASLGDFGGPPGGHDGVLLRYGVPDPGFESWASHPGTAKDDEGYAGAMSEGGAFIAGRTESNLGGPHEGNGDAWLARHEPDGQESWRLQFGGSGDEGVYALAADGAGGVFVAGDTTSKLAPPGVGSRDYYLARYSAEGEPAWIVQHGSTKTDHLSGVCSDGAGGVYLAGDTNGDLDGPYMGGLYDAYLARHDGSGALLWARQFGTEKEDIAYAVAPDGDGGVLVAGQTIGALGGPPMGNRDVFVARYDRDGDRLWVAQFGGPLSEEGRALSPDGTGGAFVAGKTGNDLGGPYAGGDGDAFVARVDGAGELLWVAQLGTAELDFATGVTGDGTGGVLIAGYTGGDLAAPRKGGFDAFRAGYSAMGSLESLRQFGSALDDVPLALAGDGAGRAILTGYTTGNLGGPRVGFNDAFVLAFDELPSCPPDCDRSGDLSLFDFLCFVNLFNAGDPAADCNGDSAFDLFDFLCFTNAFNAGCP